MELAVITIQQVFSLFLLIAAGYAGAKTNALKPEYKQAFSDLLVNLVVPAMIIDAYLVEFDPATFRNLLTAFGLAAALLIGGTGLALLITRPLKLPGKDLLQFACSFPNAAYMGFPLISALFGAEGLLYASAFSTIFNLWQWTAGVVLLERQPDPKKMLKGILSNPVIWAVAAGLVLYLGQVPVPEVIASPISKLGAMTTPLSMVITGMIVGHSDLASLVKNRWVWFIAAVRLVGIPAVGFVLFRALGLTGMVPLVTLLLEACPTAAITSVMAVRYHKDERLAAGAVVVTTLLSILTLPVWALLMTM